MEQGCFYLTVGIKAFFRGRGINFSHICPLECNNGAFVQALSVERPPHPCYFTLLLHGKTFCPAFQIDPERPWQLNKRNKLSSLVFCAVPRGCSVIRGVFDWFWQRRFIPQLFYGKSTAPSIPYGWFREPLELPNERSVGRQLVWSCHGNVRTLLLAHGQGGTGDSASSA